MQIKIILFGILRDVIGEDILHLAVPSGVTLGDLKQDLSNDYPGLIQYSNFSMAVNEAYTESDYAIKENDVIALIPPVSGG